MSAMMKIRIVVADDFPLVREPWCGPWTQIPRIEVVGRAADGREAPGRGESLQPDVMILDLRG